MSVREIGAILGLVLAVSIGGVDMAAAQERPHPRQHHAKRPCAPGDTVQGRLLGRPVRPDRMRDGRVQRGRMLHGRMMPGGMMGGFGMMHGFGMAGPARILAYREQLGLTPDQVQRLEVLAATQKRALEELMPQAMRGLADLMAAVTGEIDIDAARSAHDRLARVHSEMMVAHLQAVKGARQTLTPEQQTRWDALTSMPGGMVRPMRSMPPHAPGMHRHERCR